MNKILTVIPCLLFVCALCYGQSSYKGMTPGKSTRADAERVVGQPVQNVSKTLIEYKSPEGWGKFYIQYRAESLAAVVERMELICSGTKCSPSMLELLKPLRSSLEDARMGDINYSVLPFKQVTYYGAPRFIVSTWIVKTSDGESQDVRLAFYSNELYDTAKPKGACTGTLFGRLETDREGQAITCFGQSLFMGLTPGKSTRAAVDQVLGQPTSQVTEHLLEYNKGAKQIYVQYSKESPTAIRIQVIYSPSATRSEVLAREGLPQVADTRRTNKKGALEEYFANSKYIVLTYEENSQNQVSQVGYISRQLFESVTPELAKNSVPPLPTGPMTFVTEPNASTTSGTRQPTPQLTPAASGAEKPVTGPFLGNIPAVGGTVTGLKLFENESDDLPAVGLRPYKESFAKATVKAIYYEFSVKYVLDSATVFAMAAIWKKNSEVLTRQELSVAKPSGFNTSSKTHGFIPPTGRWDPGTYTLDIEVDGRKVASAPFTVK